MKFTGNPNLDAFNWYNDQQKKRSGPAHVVTYQNGGGYSVITSTGSELCSFKDIRGGGNQFTCLLRVNPKYGRYLPDIVRILGNSGFMWQKTSRGIVVESVMAKDKRDVMNALYSVALDIKDRIRPRD